MQKIALISTVRGPLNELKMFVNYHLNIGIDEIILFFDYPEEINLDYFTQYSQVTTIRCTPEYWAAIGNKRPELTPSRQIINVNKGIQIAREKNCNWITHIDRDELINPLSDLKKILAKCKADALKYKIMEAFSDREQYDTIFDTTYFKKNPNRRRIQVMKFLGCSSSLYNNEYFRSHKASKMAIKINDKLQKFGIHDPLEFDKSLVIKRTSQIRLLHYDCVGINEWKEKWNYRLDGTGSTRSLRTNRQEQLNAYADAKEKGEEELSKLFKKLHTIPKQDKVILYLLGMLGKVNLDRRLFDKAN